VINVAKEMEHNMGGWNAGCAERRLSGVGGAGRKPTAERQQGAVLRPHPCDREFIVALRDRSAACAAGPLRFCLCSLLSQRRHCGGAGVRAGERASHPQRSEGLGLDAQEPPRSTLRKNPRREERQQRGRRRPSRPALRGTRTPLPPEEAQGVAATASLQEPAGAAKPLTSRKRQRSAKPPGGR
jgi:hypothetical protein